MPHKNKKDLYAKQRERWDRLKVEAILYKGGKCSCCNIPYDGTNACIFDFHHINPKEKEYDWTQLRARSKEERIKELDKEILLCSNCHRKAHSKEY